jgi:hypothetical protein
MNKKNIPAHTTIQELMTEDEINTYNYSKNLSALLISKKKILKNVDIEMNNDLKRKKNKVELNYYKKLIERQNIIYDIFYK